MVLNPSPRSQRSVVAYRGLVFYDARALAAIPLGVITNGAPNRGVAKTTFDNNSLYLGNGTREKPYSYYRERISM